MRWCVSNVALPALTDHGGAVARGRVRRCRTDLHLLDGELLQATYPVTPGHEIAGRVVERGAGGGVGPWARGSAFLARLGLRILRAVHRRPGESVSDRAIHRGDARWLVTRTTSSPIRDSA